MRFLIILLLSLLILCPNISLGDNSSSTFFELYTFKSDSKNKKIAINDSFLKGPIFKREARNIIIDRKNTSALYVAIRLPSITQTGTYYIVIEDCFIDKITFYKPNKQLITGAMYPFSSREIPFQYPTFTFKKKKSKDELVLMKFQNFYHNSVIPIKIYTENEFQSLTLKSYLFWGFYLGILLLTFFVSFWMFIVHKDRIFGFVAAAIICGIFWVLFNNGLGFQFLWPNVPKVMETGRFIFYQLSYFFILICFQQFINISLKTSFEIKLLKTIKILLILSILMSLNPLDLTNDSIWLGIYFLYANSLLIFSSLYILFYLIKEIKNHNLNAWFYFISIIMIFVGTFGLTLMKYEFIKPMNYLLQINYLGIFIQVLSLIIGLLIQHFLQKKAHTQLEINLIKAQSDERQRIAIDMHDELGSSLSTIKLISELGIKQKNSPKVIETLELIHDKSIQINKKLKEIIWTLHSTNDTLESVLSYLIDTSKSFFKEVDIPFQMTIPDSIPYFALEGIKRRHIVLLLKEIFQNIAKHSKSKFTEVSVQLDRNYLTIIIQDHGIGLGENYHEGNGMKNIKERMIKLNGNLKMHEENGLIYKLIIPL